MKSVDVALWAEQFFALTIHFYFGSILKCFEYCCPACMAAFSRTVLHCSAVLEVAVCEVYIRTIQRHLALRLSLVLWIQHHHIHGTIFATRDQVSKGSERPPFSTPFGKSLLGWTHSHILQTTNYFQIIYYNYLICILLFFPNDWRRKMCALCLGFTLEICFLYHCM